MYLSNERRRAACSLFEIGWLISLFFSWLSVACILILFFFWWVATFVSNLAPSFFAQCAQEVTWKNKLVQCCTYSKWVHSRFSLLSFSRFKTLDSSNSCSCPAWCVLLLLEVPHLPTQHLPIPNPSACIPPLFNLVHLGSLPMQRSSSTLFFKTSTFLRPTLYSLSVHSLHSLIFLDVFLYLLLSCPAWLTHGSSMECCRFLRSDLIALTHGQTFFLSIALALAVASSLSSNKAYPSLNLLPPLCLYLTPTLIM